MIRKTNIGICIDNFMANGMREGKHGVAIIVNDEICNTVGVFTRNNMASPSVLLTKNRIKNGIKAVIVNSGNANALVKDGINDARKISEILGRELGIDPKNIAIASTGITGRRLEVKVIERLIRKVIPGISNSAESSKRAAEAIMTTDKRVKQISFEYKGIEIGGICKGAGMIAPELATMLCFLTTNADLKREELQDSLNKAVEESFNMLVIDGDMSTNDTILLMSNRKRRCRKRDFQVLLNYSTKELAKMIAMDGEGSTKFIEVEVRGAKRKEDAKKGAKAVVSSNLVKTAIYGENPNWGRILASIGSKIRFRFDRVDIILKSKKRSAIILEKGEVKDLNSARRILRNKRLRIVVNLNSGKESAIAYGCDLTPEYVRINAGYN